MLKGHPLGLPVIFFSNMGERFGYYTMMSIFVLFLEAKFGMTQESLGAIWGAFLFSVYFMPLFGGMLADRIGYGRTVSIGICVMILGYSLMAIPGSSTWFIIGALFVIALGTGLFKGNLVVILGNLYEGAPYKKLHDAAFNIFYMGINIGAFFAPYAATGIRDWLLARDGFTYNAKLPVMAHQFLQGTLQSTAELTALAKEQLGDKFTDVSRFCTAYTASLGQAYNAGFAIAAVSILMSLGIFLSCRRFYKDADYVASKRPANADAVELTPKQLKDRIIALILVFFVVIFFWMAFHQSGLTLTLFAKSYTMGSVGRVTKLFFDLPAFLALLGAIIGLVFLAMPRFAGIYKLGGLALMAAGAGLAYWRMTGFADSNPIAPELFQSFNPIFVVFLTPVVIGFLGWLGQRGKELSAPRKIGIGMALAAVAYTILIICVIGLQSPHALKDAGGVSPILVSPYWLISAYFTLTVAELFLSPMGLSFVAKVAPPKLRGLMQGGWLAATAIGNFLSGVIAIPYANLELWQTFLLLVCTSLLSAGFIFTIVKKLEAATGGK